MTGITGTESRHIVSVRVNATSYGGAVQQICEWARFPVGRYVCVCNVHMVMEAHDDHSFAEIVNGADLVTPDGMPLVWALRAMGVPQASRVYGPDLMLAVCAAAERDGISVGLYGSSGKTLAALRRRLQMRFPGLRIVYAHSPPKGHTRAAPAELSNIEASGLRILFVALGCPRQERWMASHIGAVPAVMVGVGAAFDFLSGEKAQAPAALQRAGLEWLFRVASEPARLWRRYLYNNPRFMALLARQLIGSGNGRKSGR